MKADLSRLHGCHWANLNACSAILVTIACKRSTGVGNGIHIVLRRAYVALVRRNVAVWPGVKHHWNSRGHCSDAFQHRLQNRLQNLPIADTRCVYTELHRLRQQAAHRWPCRQKRLMHKHQRESTRACTKTRGLGGLGSGTWTTRYTWGTFEKIALLGPPMTLPPSSAHQCCIACIQSLKGFSDNWRQVCMPVGYEQVEHIEAIYPMPRPHATSMNVHGCRPPAIGLGCTLRLRVAHSCNN